MGSYSGLYEEISGPSEIPYTIVTQGTYESETVRSWSEGFELTQLDGRTSTSSSEGVISFPGLSLPW